MSFAEVRLNQEKLSVDLSMTKTSTSTFPSIQVRLEEFVSWSDDSAAPAYCKIFAGLALEPLSHSACLPAEPMLKR